MQEILNNLISSNKITTPILIFIFLWIIWTFNKIIQNKLLVESSWADIDTQLKKRFDLIPNLVVTVRGYVSHEKETLNAVIKARSKTGKMNIDIKNISSEKMLAFQSTQREMTQMLGKLFALSESYPDLKANKNFLDLQNQLTIIENDLNMARRFYNGAVRVFNESIQIFPSNIIAKLFNFKEKPFFKATKEERVNNELQF